MNVKKFLNKDILYLTEELDKDTEENQTSNLPFIGTQETPVSNFEENLVIGTH